ncbi:LysM domain-containing protein [Tahibacter harae]|uniref:LysM domain-containing protein n=1 Tax=Tahibacter harae TaxID=2963937 RepID=A0ABT1QRL9_9GAMM|nr:LysM domain-containing protein [Tahibacter harae]MCQ4164906.1 LysM domain-containing protein [Tahibacter harae]
MPNYNFPPTSRYYDTELGELEGPDGRRIPYLRRRFLPAPERFALLREHRIGEGERLDHIAAHELGDAEAFWRLCDANAGELKPEALCRSGRRLRITLPLGVPAPARS